MRGEDRYGPALPHRASLFIVFHMGLGGAEIYSAVCKAVREGALAEPFRALDVRRVAPGWAYPRYFEFLADHCTDKQSPDVALFVRVAKGRYRLNDQKAA